MPAFSLRQLEEVLPERFAGWVRWAGLLAIMGYGLLLAMSAWGLREQEPLVQLGEALAFTLAIVALGITQWGRPTVAVLILALGLGAEAHWTIFLNGNLAEGGALLLPLLLLAAGALLGGRWPLVLAVATVLSVTVALYLGGLRSGVAPGGPRFALEDLAVLAIVLVATAVLLMLAVGSFERVLALARARAQQVADLIHHAPDALLVVDENENLRVANPAAERLFGRSAEALLQGSIHDLGLSAPPDTGGADDAPADVVARMLEGSERPLMLTLPNERVVEATSRWIDGPGRRLQILFRDVTERVEAEAARWELEARLQHAHKLQAVTVLAGGVAHDFHNLFTVVRGTAELLRLENDERLQDLADDLITAQERGTMLTGKLLTFAQRGTSTPESVDLAELVRSASVFLESVLGERARLTLSLGGGEARVRVDSGQMDQALAHLVNNARDAGARNVEISLEAKGADVLLTVRDDGRGMDPRTRDHMFDPFFTTKGQGVGTGLSLSTVLGIVDGHGGTVEVDSAPGGGTSVGLRLPRAAPPVA